jgi:hypothetical protein
MSSNTVLCCDRTATIRLTFGTAPELVVMLFRSLRVLQHNSVFLQCTKFIPRAMNFMWR